MKKIFILSIFFVLSCSIAHAGWFSKKKDVKSEAVESVEISTERKPIFKSSDETQTDWSALQNAEEVMDAVVPRFNSNKINNVHPGMTHAQVQKILGDSVLVGYQDIRGKDAGHQNILLKNPYRAEILEGLGKIYEVFFYITDVKSPDGKISDDELTPVIFEADELVGKDWGFYEKLKNQLKGHG